MKKITAFCLILWLLICNVSAFCKAETGDARLVKTVLVYENNDNYDNGTVITEYYYNDKGWLEKELSYGFVNGEKVMVGTIRYENDKNGVVRTKHAQQFPIGEYESHYDSYGHVMEGMEFIGLGWICGLSAGNIDCYYDGENLTSATVGEDTFFYEYDANGRVITVTSTNDSWLDKQYSYLPSGNYKIYGQEKSGQGRYTEEEYRSDGKILHYLAGNIEDGRQTVHTDLMYAYDQEGNLTKWYGIWWGGETPDTWSDYQYEYQYRADGQLQQSVKYDRNRGSEMEIVETITYYYDP